MNVTVSKGLEQLIRQKVEEGRYSSEDEVVAAALRLLQERDEVAAIRRARLDDAVDRGYDDVASGKVTSLETGDQIDTFSLSCEASRARRSPRQTSNQSAATHNGLGEPLAPTST